MKGNIFLIIIALVIAALAGYGFYAANSGEQYVFLIAGGAGIKFASTLAGLIGLSTDGRAGGMNIKALSLIFFVLFLVSNLVFSFTAVKPAPYIIVNGILLLVYAAGFYGIVKSGM